MSKEQEIINKIEQVNNILHDVLLSLKEEKQLDFCNCPSLANRVVEMEFLYKAIDKIVYQK
jgi:hypothetical protein